MKFRRAVSAILTLAVGISMIPALNVSARSSVRIDTKTFPDAAFRKYISDNFDKDHDGSLASEELTGVEVIYLSGPAVKNLKGIGYFGALKHLFIYSSEISRLDLTKNTNLEQLTVRSNKIRSLDLSKNKKITHLDILEDHALSSIDVSNCRKLKKFWFSMGWLKELTVSSGMKFESTHYGGNKPPTWSSSNKKVASAKTGKTRDSMGGPETKLILTAGKEGKAVLTEKWGWGKRKFKIRVLYKDVTDSSKSWFDPIYSLTDKGIVKGYEGKTRFKPGAKCTRAQLVMLLWRLEGCPKVKKYKNKFSDVKKTDYFYDAVKWAASKKIIEGYSDGKFRPQRMCSRRHVVTFLWKFAGRPEPNAPLNRFKDIKSTDFFYKAALWATEQGIVEGFSDGTFRPNGICLRRQIVTYVYKYDKNIKAS